MVQVLALFAGVLATWLLTVQHSFACALVTARLTRPRERTFTSALQFAILHVGRLGSAFLSALGVVRGAIAADVQLAPALVLVRAPFASALGLAAFANIAAVSSAVVVVGVDGDGLLVHLNEEGGEELRDARLWEGRVARVFGEPVQS